MQRLASVTWRQQRADRLEAEVLTQLEQRHDPPYIGGYVPSSPRTWDAARFGAVQRQQARLDRTLFQLLDELDRLPPADREDREESPNEPDGATLPVETANDDTEEQNEPKPPPAAAVAPVAPPAPGDHPPPGRAAAELLLAGGRVKPANDLLRAMLARGNGRDGPGI